MKLSTQGNATGTSKKNVQFPKHSPKKPAALHHERLTVKSDITQVADDIRSQLEFWHLAKEVPRPQCAQYKQCRQYKQCNFIFPRGSMYTTSMELGPKRPSLLWFWDPNSIIGVYMDPLGSLFGLQKRKLWGLRFGNPEFSVVLSVSKGLCVGFCVSWSLVWCALSLYRFKYP